MGPALPLLTEARPRTQRIVVVRETKADALILLSVRCGPASDQKCDTFSKDRHGLTRLERDTEQPSISLTPCQSMHISRNMLSKRRNNEMRLLQGPAKLRK